MQSLMELYRIGLGPSSSHTMAPRLAAEAFAAKCTAESCFRVTLYGSLAATGKGHLTDRALMSVLGNDLDIVWKPDVLLPRHPNGMRFEAFDQQCKHLLLSEECYSLGGGALFYEGDTVSDEIDITYPQESLAEIFAFCQERELGLVDYVQYYEPDLFAQHLPRVWRTMQAAIARGLEKSEPLEGALKLGRKAKIIYEKLLAEDTSLSLHRTGFISAYTYAVSEENASAGEIVTAPSCGACGVLPGLLYYLQETEQISEMKIYEALAVAGIIGNVTKKNASISGAEVGCQGEVGTACAMAAAAACYLVGGNEVQIEYAAEMGLEHHLGLTCDPVAGLVQIPCIERNAVAACRAYDVAQLALLHGEHRVSFDDVVAVMAETGRDLQERYRETAMGGLAKQLLKQGRLAEQDIHRNICD